MQDRRELLLMSVQKVLEFSNLPDREKAIVLSFLLRDLLVALSKAEKEKMKTLLFERS